MRIITGSAKGTKLKTPRGLATRPTSDRVKESIFNILNTAVVDATVLDLFAGTGNLGLEALSRGAAKAYFVDNSLASINLIKDNAVITKLNSCVEVIKSDVLKVLGFFAANKIVFDIIYCDPPYNQGLVKAVLHKIDESCLLCNNGIIVIEHSRHESVTADYNNLLLKRSERYGETEVSFLINKF